MKISPSMDRESINGQGMNNGSGRSSTHNFSDYQAKKGMMGLRTISELYYKLGRDDFSKNTRFAAFLNSLLVHLGYNYDTYGKDGGVGWCRSLIMLLMALLLVTVGSGISLLYIYTGGHLDQRSIERALPVIKHDVYQGN